jgi:hypothetical protein
MLPSISLPYMPCFLQGARIHMGDVGWTPGLVHPTQTEIIIVRHGETTWNKSGRLQASNQISLRGKRRMISLSFPFLSFRPS